MRHPFVWGVVFGVAGLWAYEHFFSVPRAPMGKAKR